MYNVLHCCQNMTGITWLQKTRRYFSKVLVVAFETCLRRHIDNTDTETKKCYQPIFSHFCHCKLSSHSWSWRPCDRKRRGSSGLRKSLMTTLQSVNHPAHVSNAAASGTAHSPPSDTPRFRLGFRVVRLGFATKLGLNI